MSEPVKREDLDALARFVEGEIEGTKRWVIAVKPDSANLGLYVEAGKIIRGLRLLLEELRR